MSRWIAWAALALGALAWVPALRLRQALARQSETVATLEEQLRARPEQVRDGPLDDSELAGLREAVASLGSRLERLETRRSSASRRPVEQAPEDQHGEREGSAAEALSAPGSAEAADGAEGATREELDALLESILGTDYNLQGPPEDIERFFAIARSTDLIDERIEELEELVAARPGDVDGRMRLADSYIAKLMTLSGPEQGLWGGRAEAQWREVTERDPDHWRAAFSLGNNYAYYPDVMNKTADSIRYLEQARAIQERSEPAPEHVRTYVSLSQMHLRGGDTDEARAVLEAGLRFHPGNEVLLGALARFDR